MGVDVLTASSKGQVVIPARMRRAVGIAEGSKLAAYSYGDTIVLKLISLPTEEDFKASLDEAERWAASVGLTEDEVDDAIAAVRARRA